MVFCSKKSNGSTVIVGWYENAVAYRNCKGTMDLPYFFETKTDDAYLVKEKDREFIIKRANEGGFGPGQKNIRYIKDIDVEEINKILSYIYNNKTKSIIFNKQKNDEKFNEIARKIEINGKTTKQCLSEYRTYQGKFRELLMSKYGSKCAICGLEIPEILIVSHIKAHSESNESERKDIDNGLLLCANHDALFDKHLLSFDDNGKIIISKIIDKKDYSKLGINSNISICLNDQNKKYMKKHRKILKQKEKMI